MNKVPDRPEMIFEFFGESVRESDETANACPNSTVEAFDVVSFP